LIARIEGATGKTIARDTAQEEVITVPQADGEEHVGEGE